MGETPVLRRMLKIANAQAFWGDDPNAAGRLAELAPDVDVITLDYLAEVSMSILAKQRERDPSAGYARDFLGVVKSLLPFWQASRTLKVVTNAGGLDPLACAKACKAIVPSLKIGVVTGDDVLPLLRRQRPDLITANAYIGAAPVADALRRGADLVITGRVADPSLTVGPALAHYGWTAHNYDAIAGFTVAGHLIECGTQVTGGISTDWLSLPKLNDIGFPIVEIAEDGSCVVTKPAGTGGRVSALTVKEQLVYELGDPANYLSPDATVSFLSIQVKDLGDDRVSVSGATGRLPPGTYKVSATYRAGWRASGMLTVFGRDAEAKARKCGVIVREKLQRMNVEPEQYCAEVLGIGAVAPIRGTDEPPVPGNEVVLRITVADKNKEKVEAFTRQLMPLISAGSQGITGYAEGRPQVREVFGYWPTTIDRSLVQPRVEILE